MKKWIALLMAAIIMLTLVACTGNETPETTDQTESQETETTPEVQVPGSAVEILETIWNGYGEDEKFYVMGGDTVTPVDNAPGTVSLTETDFLVYNLKVPEGEIANITDAASMIHGMLANNFTCGVYRVEDAQTFANTMHDAVSGTQWVCGMPDEMIVAVIADAYVVVAYGVGEAMTSFNTQLSAAYPDAQIVYHEAVVE